MLKTTAVLIVLFTAIHIKMVSAIENMQHVHGVAELTIAMINNEIQVDFVAPADSLLGFEHQAISANEIAKVTKVKQLLSKPENLLVFHQGLCQVKLIDIDTSEVLVQHSHSEHQANNHAEITTSYQFDCEKSAKVSSISVNLFKHFQGIESIQVHWINDIKQGSSQLNGTNNSFKIK